LYLEGLKDGLRLTKEIYKLTENLNNDLFS